MSSVNITDFVRRINRLEQVYKTLPNTAAVIAVNFSKERFNQQNWVNNITEPWKKRKKQGAKRNQGRAILVKSGRLKRSIRKLRANGTTIVIGTDVPYAAAHNYGFRGKVNVRAHKRGKFHQVSQGTGIFNVRTRTERTRSSRQATGNTSDVKEHTRNATLPRRQFLGESKALAMRIERQFAAEVLRAIR